MIPYFQFSQFSLGPITIRIWGLFLVIGILAGFWWVLQLARQRKINLDNIWDLSLWLLIAGIIGGRLAYILVHLKDYASWLEWLKLWQGGMSFLGGLVLTILVGGLYVWRKKLSLWQLADFFTPPLFLGYFIGRIGCFLIHDHIGKEMARAWPWGIKIGAGVFHETSIYTGLLGLTLAIFSWWLLGRKKPAGFVFLSTILIYTVIRFIIEFFQVGPWLWGLTYNQWGLLGILAISIFFYLKNISSKSKI